MFDRNCNFKAKIELSPQLQLQNLPNIRSTQKSCPKSCLKGYNLIRNLLMEGLSGQLENVLLIVFHCYSKVVWQVLMICTGSLK